MRRHIGLYAVVALVTVVMLVVAACGGGEEAPTAEPRPTAAPATAAPAATAPLTAAPQPTATPRPVVTPTPTPTPAPVEVRPQRGGIVNVRMNTDVLAATAAWDSHGSSGYVQIKIGPNLYNGTLILDPLDSTKIVTDLAESYTVSSDGTLWTIKYRPGVKYHDGQPFKASDVIFSYKRVSGEIPSFPAKPHKGTIGDYVASMTAPDDLTLQIRLQRPAGSFIYSLAYLFNVIMPERLGPNYPLDPNNVPIGTGPYKLLERRADVHIKVRRNPDYFKKDKNGEALPYLDGADFIVIQDTFTAFSAFRAGKFIEADYLDPGVLNTQIDAIKKQFPDYIFGTGFGSWRHYLINNKPPFNDVRVRRAIDLLVDRPGFVAARYPGYGHAGASPMLPPSIGGSWGLTDQETSTLINTGPVTPERIAQARDLLRQAGINLDTFTFKFMSLNFQVFLEDAIVVQDSWKKAGLKTELEIVSSAELVPKRTKGEFDVYYLPATAAVDDPDLVLGAHYKTGGGENYGKWSDPKVDQLYLEQSSTIDAAKRKTIVQDLQRYILTNANWLNKIAWAGSWVAWSPRIKNYNAVCGGAYCHRGRFETTWLVPE